MNELRIKITVAPCKEEQLELHRDMTLNLDMESVMDCIATFGPDFVAAKIGRAVLDSLKGK